MQRFEFKSAKAGRFVLPDGLNGPRGAYELIPNLRGAALTAPWKWRFTTFPSSAMNPLLRQPFNIQGAIDPIARLRLRPFGPLSPFSPSWLFVSFVV